MDPLESLIGPAWPTAEAFAAATGVDPLVAVKLWENPCWFSFRLNYLALHFNGPVYGWIQKRHGVMRPDYVVLYSLALKDGLTAKAISDSSGFPKNTISRVVQSLLERGLIARTQDPVDRRSFRLDLTAEGRRITDQTLQPMVERERLMLARLSPAERHVLAELLAKVVAAAPGWPDALFPGSAPSPDGTPRSSEDPK